MDAIQFLKKEHVTAKAAFEDVLKASPKKRGDLWEKLSPELEAHEQIEDAKQMLPFTEDDLRGTRYPALVFFLVLHQIGSSHCQSAPAESFPKLAERPGYIPQNPRIAPPGLG